MLALSCTAIHAESLVLGDFSTKSLQGWEKKTFNGETLYTFVTTPHKDRIVLRADSQNSASGLFLKKDIDLNQTPFLSWTWKTSKSSLLQNPTHNERSKSGDDYTLRLYIVIEDPPFFWRTRALNYVWSANQPVNSHWASPYTKNSTMIAIDSGKAMSGKWQYHKRNLKEDIKKYLGMDATTVHAIALMSDSDNTHGFNLGYFGDIIISSK